MVKVQKSLVIDSAENQRKKPALSNSRLGVHSGGHIYFQLCKLSFDGFTIVGNLNKDKAQELSDFMAFEPRVRLWENMTDKFKAKALDEKVYIEHDRLKADSWDRRNFRIEFNPNKLDLDEMEWLKKHFIDLLEDDGFTRIDLAFDFEDDLSDYFAMSEKALKKTFFYGTNGKIETRYFGVRSSDRFVRIYNKKQERKDIADIDLNIEHLWRVEIELKRGMVDYWNNCFEDLHIIKPAWKTIENINERAMIYMLMNEEDEWGKLERKTKYKYKKLIENISPIDLTSVMKDFLKMHEKDLEKQINFWVGA